MSNESIKEFKTAKYLNAGDSHIFQDRELLNAEHLAFYKLGQMVKVGMPVLSSLRFIVNETNHDGLRQALSEIVASIESGKALAESMDKPLFAPSTIAMVAVGEVTGQLSGALLAVAECLGKQLAAS